MGKKKVEFDLHVNDLDFDTLVEALEEFELVCKDYIKQGLCVGYYLRFYNLSLKMRKKLWKIWLTERRKDNNN